MLSVDQLKEFIIVATALSTITCAFIQKTKGFLKTKKILLIYSFFVNMIMSILFCFSFTKIKFPMSMWIGLFSFIGADTLYKSLEGKLSSYTELRSAKSIIIKPENLINKKEAEFNGKTNISK